MISVRHEWTRLKDGRTVLTSTSDNFYCERIFDEDILLDSRIVRAAEKFAEQMFNQAEWTDC